MDYSYPQEEAGEIKARILWLGAAVFVIFGVLLLRTWYLQIVQEDLYREMAANNRVRLLEVPAPRGFLYDRNGNLLVNNVPSFNLYLVLEDIPDLARTLERLSGLIGLTQEELSQRISAKRPHTPFRPFKVKSDLTLKQVALIEGHLLDLPGIRIEVEGKRNYIYGKLAAHLLGHVGEITAEQLKQGSYGPARSGTTVGQYGIEKTYDAWIQGKSGQKSIEVDAQGYQRSVLEIREPIRGNNLYLTLDLNLQRAAEEAIGEKSGAIVAMDPWTGDVLAMVSYPSFDPNLLSGTLTPAAWEALVQDPGHLLNNRVIQGQYPPGSVFKIVVSTAMMETDTVDPQFTVNCTGGMYFGRRLFRDWKRGGHGEVGLHRAIVESCDVFFYKVGKDLGVETLGEYARALGLGRPTGIPLVSEKGGLVPSKDWKLEKVGEPWYPGDTLSVAIGQGYVSVTPLQMAVMVSTLATQGYQYQPRILKSTSGINGTQDEPAPILSKVLALREQTFQALRLALRGVVQDEHGTGKKADSQAVDIGGKTGTAQVVRLSLQSKDKEIPMGFRDHAWFVAMAPLDHPEIVVVVLVEHGGHGGTAAAPIAKLIIEEFLEHDRSPGRRTL